MGIKNRLKRFVAALDMSMNPTFPVMGKGLLALIVLLTVGYAGSIVKLVAQRSDNGALMLTMGSGAICGFLVVFLDIAARITQKRRRRCGC